ncbi:nuclear factor of activated T-cells, cytoplasmic 3-like isoform X2 [Syngnathus typhle]|uniref:nuclear factor of activated T-cells, cytoplasmic 3-like isoform X2 n=1 Tax=Syngnathus typhle TaxID=161592 RepID=UPI002A6A952D|nr:nuclear factor of activated T-cells, cytoplasmic 3-like isoform X2 [Syngnathus typhle]
MSSAKCAEEELDFALIFEEDSGQGEGLRPHVTAPPWPMRAAPPCRQYALSDDCARGSSPALHCPSIQITAIAANNDDGGGGSGGQCAESGYVEAAWPRDQLYLPLDPCYRDAPFCPSPCSSVSSRSWVSDLSSCDSLSHAADKDAVEDLRDAALLLALGSSEGGAGGGGGAFGVELWQQKYQDPAHPALSPHQSPQHSPRTSVTEDTWMSRWPSSRLTARPASPCGKRRHAEADAISRSPSPQRWSSDDAWAGHSLHELDVPPKTRRTLGTQLVGDSPLEEVLDVEAPPPAEESGAGGDLSELFLRVPAHFSWTGAAPLFRASSPPPLDFPLPSGFGPNRLSVEAEPRPYHRAHYETEGSRGAVKAGDGGHPRVKVSPRVGNDAATLDLGRPCVQLSGPCWRPPAGLLLFMGTADERCPVRPHAFYQVHRVTGKTVSTPCQERTLNGTKVLEIPLTPDMRATIDCAGILKLRNADIELKNGEADAGRKNTRLRLAFRVAVPQSDGRTLWLQTASRPIECSQRSGQDFPRVERFAPSCCRREGGQRLLIMGSNLSSRSRVVFLEKSHDGRVLWETDAAGVLEASSNSSLTVVVPAYGRDAGLPAHVLFYVCNGKRRRSAQQSFTYLPGVLPNVPPPTPLLEQEPRETGPPSCRGDEQARHERWARGTGTDIQRETEDILASASQLQEITLDDDHLFYNLCSQRDHRQRHGQSERRRPAGPARPERLQ